MRKKIAIYKVGGAVRDRLLGQPVKDVDWVVVGASAEDMIKQGYQPVGDDFPVFLHPITHEEYALARTERKNGKGYGGFTFFADPTVTLEQDLIRRDLTINAIAEDQQGKIYDPYNGQQDLVAKVLRHVSLAFIEDPLRVLRVARFAARYTNLGFVVADETLALMTKLSQSGELSHLTAERVWKEFASALMEASPDIFISILFKCHALAVLLPELLDLPRVLTLLRQAAITKQPLAIRWACLIVPFALSGDIKTIQQINQRFKVPNEYADLAILAGQYLVFCEQSLIQSPASLLHFLQRIDVLRRPERLALLIQLAELIMNTMDRPLVENNNSLFLQVLAHKIRELDPQSFIKQGFKGADLGARLDEEKLAIIKEEQAKFKRIKPID